MTDKTATQVKHAPAADAGRDCLLDKTGVSVAPQAARDKTKRSRADKPQELVGIRRRYNDETASYQLDVVITRNGMAFNKSFSENRYGGEHETMRLARAWRDAIVAEHPPMSLAEHCAILRSNNTSGVSGVRRAAPMPLDENGDVIGCYPCWVADIPLGNGKSRNRTFSVNKYGEEGARQRAIAAREKALAELEGLVRRADQQPQAVSRADDIAHLDARLRAQEEHRRQKLAARAASRKRAAQRTAALQAQAQAAEQKALQTANNSGEPYIARAPTKKGRGGLWTVSIKRLGKRYMKSFFDSTHGGTAQALEAAKAWRDQTFLSLPVMTKAQALTNLQPANASGVAGVGRKIVEKEGGRILESWIAYSPKLEGRRGRSRQFSIGQYGEQQAFELAVKAREAFIAELADVPHLPKHPAKQMMHALHNSGQTLANAESVSTTQRGAAALLDAVKEKLGIGGDVALSRVLGVKPAMVSKLRNGRLITDPALLRRIHEATGIDMADLENLYR